MAYKAHEPRCLCCPSTRVTQCITVGATSTQHLHSIHTETRQYQVKGCIHISAQEGRDVCYRHIVSAKICREKERKSLLDNMVNKYKFFRRHNTTPLSYTYIYTITGIPVWERDASLMKFHAANQVSRWTNCVCVCVCVCVETLNDQVYRFSHSNLTR